jgi:hypothetical protein
MGGRRLLPGPLGRLAADGGLKVEYLGYWNSWLTPLLWLQARLEPLGPSETATSVPTGTALASEAAQASDVQLPPPWLNRALVMLLQLEESCTGILPLPWGSSLMLSARRPETAGPRQSERMAAEGSRGA